MERYRLMLHPTHLELEKDGELIKYKDHKIEVKALRKANDKEKEIRIKYQDVVYKICIIIDRCKGGGSIVTVDQVVDEVERLIKRRNNTNT